jgi:hypothetical protein
VVYQDSFGIANGSLWDDFVRKKALDLVILVLLAPTFSTFFFALMGANILALLHVSFLLVRGMFSYSFLWFLAAFYILVLVHLLGYSLRLLSFHSFSFSFVFWGWSV